MSIEYLDLADFLVISEEITGLEVSVLMKMSRLSLADSALHAPRAGFGDVDLYRRLTAALGDFLIGVEEPPFEPAIGAAAPYAATVVRMLRLRNATAPESRPRVRGAGSCASAT